MPTKEPVWYKWLGTVIVFLIGGVLTLAAAWGALNQQVQSSEKRIDEVKLDLRADIHRVEEKLDRLIENLIGP